MDTNIAKAALSLTEGLEQGAAKDRVVKAFFAGVASCAPDKITPVETMAVAMSGAAVVEKWAADGVRATLSKSN